MNWTQDFIYPRVRVWCSFKARFSPRCYLHSEGRYIRLGRHKVPVDSPRKYHHDDKGYDSIQVSLVKNKGYRKLRRNPPGN